MFSLHRSSRTTWIQTSPSISLLRMPRTTLTKLMPTSVSTIRRYSSCKPQHLRWSISPHYTGCSLRPRRQKSRSPPRNLYTKPMLTSACTSPQNRRSKPRLPPGSSSPLGRCHYRPWPVPWCKSRSPPRKLYTKPMLTSASMSPRDRWRNSLLPPPRSSPLGKCHYRPWSVPWC